MKFFLICVVLFLLGCSTAPPETLFSEIAKESGINFRNELVYTEQVNPYTFRNFYNGAGVAIGDINNDGLPDIYFAGNQVDNKLYLNQGNFSFKDITEPAGVGCHGAWSTGVTFVDINADGFLDIYVCKSGSPDTPKRNNELFINNGDLTFTERAKEYGLDVMGLSIQASFFDYDKDGDLDCYLLTNSIKAVGNYDIVKNQREIPDSLGGGNKFFLNEGGKFKDHTDAAGIYHSNIGFGLGITLGDFNEDGWTDIFVSNDFFERDYLYINKKDGSFKESLTDYFSSISMGSMGADLADLDNDGVSELFVTEMLPDSLSRRKTKTVYDSWNRYELNVGNGYYHQFPRNVLQKRIGNNAYAEIGRLAGVAASEWSWGALLFDMDNDGRRDIFIANGIYKDLLDRDYLTFTGAEDNVRKIIREEKEAIVKLINLMPSSAFENYAFRNDGDFHFTNMTKQWGLDQRMYSNGSAFGDLDSDGDVDLVINNIGGSCAVYRNNTDTTKFKSISVSLSSQSKNRFALGSKIIVYANGKSFYSDNFSSKGFQSAVSSDVQIGLGENVNQVDSLIIEWPDRGCAKLYNLAVNQKVRVEKEKSTIAEIGSSRTKFEPPFQLELVARPVKHTGSGLIDFNRDRLIPMMYSNETPAILKGDVNNDGVTDIYTDRGKGQSASLIHFKNEKFIAIDDKSFDELKLPEETKGSLFDADGDGDLDLYIATGGRFFPKTSNGMEDKILINSGNGKFVESSAPLPFAEYFSTSVVMPIDFDNDHDLDLFVGERFDPFVYGMGGRGYLLENNGKGSFKDVTRSRTPELLKTGMVTDAKIADVDNDGWSDIIIVGDWISIIVLQNLKGNFKNISNELGLSQTRGWWNTIEVADFNHDNKIDFVAGNHGKNSFFNKGDRMYINDFDENGSVEQIFCSKIGDKYYPIVDKDELLSQLPSLKKQLLYYKDYGKKSIDEIFSETVLSRSKIEEVDMLSTTIFLSGLKEYKILELPLEAQYSPIYALLVSDFDNDGVLDLIAGGNQYNVKPQFGRYDASGGWFFRGVLNKNEFSFERGKDLSIKGQIRDIELIEIKSFKYILFAKYDDELEIYKLHF